MNKEKIEEALRFMESLEHEAASKCDFQADNIITACIAKAVDALKEAHKYASE